MEEPEFNSDESFEPLSELEKSKMEQAMLEIAYENSYRVLTKRVAFEDLVEEKDLIGVSALMAYDPTEGIRKDELENMIQYYLEIDESEYYLRCAELKKMLDEMV